MKQGKLWEYTKAIIIALILALLIRAYVVQAFKIPSGSMLPTLLIGDHILVNKFIYGTRLPFSENRALVFQRPERGDLIVFRYPEGNGRDFIKRVIAIEGDIIESRDKKIFINGKPINEPYIQHTDDLVRPAEVEPRDNFGPYRVPENKLFVMGDNRDQSYDSRYMGYVDIENVKGEAFIIYWSWDNIRNFPRFNRIGNLIH